MAFRFGYLLLPSSQPVPVPGWHRIPVGRGLLVVHPELGHGSATVAERSVHLLGDPVDLDLATADATTAALEAVRRWHLGGDDAVVRYLAYLGGRWTAVLADGDRTTVVPDCAGTQGTYWQDTPEGTVVGSHVRLVAEVTGAPEDTDMADRLRAAKADGIRGVVYWPGLRTAAVGVLPLLPNHLLRCEPSAAAAPERFYPFVDTALTHDPEVAYARFVDLFTRHVALLCRGRTVSISLTGGCDSGAALAAARVWLREDSLMWTGVDLDRPHAPHRKDAAAARARADAVGARHVVVDLSQQDRSDGYVAAYERTWGPARHFGGFAAAARLQLPRHHVELQSMVAEVGTGFDRRPAGPMDLDAVAAFYADEPLRSDPAVRATLAEMVALMQLEPGSTGELAWQDVVYWELRAGRWSVTRIQENDMAHRVLLPFNQRGLLEALMGPRTPRPDKGAVRRYVAEALPGG